MEIKLHKRFAKYLAPVIAGITTIVAVLIVTINLSSTPATRTVLIAAKDLSEGQYLQPSDVSQVNLPLGSLASNYLMELKGSLILNRSVAKGELITTRGVGHEVDVLIPVRLNNLRPISKAISVGDRVDIWATEQSHTVSAAPEPVAFNAIVSFIEANNNMTQNSTNIEIRISEDYLETILTAIDSNFQISVILHETLSDIG